MECLYIPELSASSVHITVTDDEFRHGKALRLREGSTIMVSNGAGLCAETVVREFHARQMILETLTFLPAYNEAGRDFHLCIGNLDSKERLEFVVEKAVELGARSITIAITRYSSQRVHQAARLRAKAIAAMKQCRRSVLPTITVGESLKQAVQSISASTHILCDVDGTRPGSVLTDTCLCVGPEGGFHEDETDFLVSLEDLKTWKLATTRLRAETAAVAILSHAAAG